MRTVELYEPVAFDVLIVGQIAHGATIEEVPADYPDLEPGDVQQALEYAAWLVQEGVVTG